MATNFPTSLDTYATLVDNSDAIIAAHANDRGDAIEGIEVKVGADSSAVATSHDYLLTHLPAQVQNWDAGAVDVRGQTLTADKASGIPIIITSTTACTNLNADMVDGTHLSGLQTILTNSAGLAAAVNDETGTGVVVFNTSPTLVTPTIGVATATTVNKVTITAPAASATLTIANTKTLTVTGDATISATPYTPSGTDVAVADGGTGASTAAAGLNNLLPAQTGNAGKYLQTDASNASWQTLTTPTQVNDTDAGTSLGGSPVTFLSVAKTITSGKTVMLLASGYVNSTTSHSLTITLKQGSTTVQTVGLKHPLVAVQSGDTDINTPWSTCGIVTGLSGAVTFTVVVSAGSGTAYGNLVVMEF